MTLKTLTRHLLLLAPLLLLVGNAEARGISGWAWTCCSSMEGDIELKGVPNPDKKPTVIKADAVLNTVEIICKNPAENGITNGNAFDSIVSDFNILDPSDFLLGDNGKAIVDVDFDLCSFETSEYCTNDNWQPIAGTAWLLDMTVTIAWHFCSDTLCSDYDPIPADSVSLYCELPAVDEDGNPVERNDDYKTPNVPYDCTLLD